MASSLLVTMIDLERSLQEALVHVNKLDDEERNFLRECMGSKSMALKILLPNPKASICPVCKGEELPPDVKDIVDAFTTWE